MGLINATEKLNEVFSIYRLQEGLRNRSCECCVSLYEIKQLTSQPLKKLSLDEIGHFSRSAISTFGDVEDLKHFLPKILELFQDSSYDLIDDFLTFEKLNYAEWNTWEIQEIEAIKNYFLALWEVVISDEEVCENRISAVLTLVSEYVGVEAALQSWERSCSKKSITFIVDLILKGEGWGVKGFDIQGFMLWASEDMILNKIEELYFGAIDELEANRISVAYTLLEKISKENPIIG